MVDKGVTSPIKQNTKFNRPSILIGAVFIAIVQIITTQIHLQNGISLSWTITIFIIVNFCLGSLITVGHLFTQGQSTQNGVWQASSSSFIGQILGSLPFFIGSSIIGELSWAFKIKSFNPNDFAPVIVFTKVVSLTPGLPSEDLMVNIILFFLWPSLTFGLNYIVCVGSAILGGAIVNFLASQFSST